MTSCSQILRSVILACCSLGLFAALPAGAETAASSRPTKRIVIFGDSITAGYGIDNEAAFPALLQTKIDAAALPYSVINAGLSGETSAGGLRRIQWILRQPLDVFVLELGGNDALRGQDLLATEKNLTAIIAAVKQRFPQAKIVVAGMQVPPNLGREYTNQFREMFPRVARENDALLVPFLLEGVGGQTHLNQPDGIHPTLQGHQLIAETLWKLLQPLLN